MLAVVVEQVLETMDAMGALAAVRDRGAGAAGEPVRARVSCALVFAAPTPPGASSRRGRRIADPRQRIQSVC